MAVAGHLPRRSRASLDARTAALLALGTAFVALAVTVNALRFADTEPKALVLLPFAAIAAAVAIIKPSWLLPAFVGITWTSIGPAALGGLPSPIEVGAIVFLVVAIVRARKNLPLAREALIIAALFFLPILIAGLMSPTGDALGSMPDALKRVLFIPVIALCVPGIAGVERVTTALVITGMVLGLGAIYSVVVGPTEIFPIAGNVDLNVEAPRAVGPFGEANFFALSLAVILPFALYHIQRGGWRAWLGYPCAVLIVGGCMAAGSRGGLLTCLAVLILYAAVSGNRRLRWGAVAVIIGAVAIAPLFASQATSSEDRSVEGRATENVIAALMWADHPLTGVGPRQYPILYRDYAVGHGNDSRIDREPHNLVLEVMAEQGIVGLLSWAAIACLLLAIIVRRKIWHSMLGKSVLLAMVAYLFGTLFLHGSQMRLAYMLIGLLLALAAALPRTRPPGAKTSGTAALT